MMSFIVTYEGCKKTACYSSVMDDVTPEWVLQTVHVELSVTVVLVLAYLYLVEFAVLV